MNDNLVRNALVVLALFRAGSAGPVLVALAAGLFIFPYIMLSASAGQLADGRDKARLIRALKLTELILMSIAGLGFLLDSLPVLVAVLVGLGVQASLFSPLKYGILPDHLQSEELLAGNGVIEATTFIAILVGTIAGGWLILLPYGALTIAAVGLSVSTVGLLTALPIPPAPPYAQAAFDWHLVGVTVKLLRQARSNKAIWRAVIGISWFWTLSAALVAELPVVAKVTLTAGSEVVTLLLTMSTLGIGIGSLLCARVLRGKVSVRHLPLALLGISLFTGDFASSCYQAQGLASVPAIMGSPLGWRVLLDLGLLSICGGFYSVPLYTMIQQQADPTWRARTIAANNVVNAAFMLGGSAVMASLAAIGTSAINILFVTAMLNLLVALWSLRFLQTSS